MIQNFDFKNILVIGLGMIGGSLLYGLQSRRFKGTVYGLDTNSEVMKSAHNLNLINNAIDEMPTNLNDVLVIFAVPTLSINTAMAEVLSKFEFKNVLYTDTCSVKSSVLEAIQDTNQNILNNFILSHPIAGSEKSGLSASSESLYDKRLAIICPHEGNKEEDIKKIENLWKGLGSMTKRLPASVHDDLFAKTSHLPHIISYALMDTVFNDLKEDSFLHSGGSLEDYTRIASSDPVMWKDIMIANKSSVLEAIDNFSLSLDKISSLIKEGNPDKLVNFFSSIKTSRDMLLPEKNK
jgi:prephenate dehydrogenase